MRIDKEALEGVLAKGHDSVVLRARLAFMEDEGVRRYVAALIGEERVRPNMLPTQASGRWSTTDPPLVNFPPDCIDPACPAEGSHMAHSVGCTGWSAREIVLPDEGWWWMGHDYDAIEARLLIFAGGDSIDLEPLKKGWDIHTITAAPLPIVGYPLPPDLRNPHTAPCTCGGTAHPMTCPVGWRETLRWAGKEDRRRYLGKTYRYTLTYAKDAKGILLAKDIGKTKLRAQQLIEIGDKYLKLRPGQMAFKRRHWEAAVRLGETRTLYGTRRKLFGSRDNIEKEGFSQVIQGTVADLMDLLIIDIAKHWPESRLVLNKHDGLLTAFPNSLPPDVVVPEMKAMVTATRKIGDLEMDFPAEFHAIDWQGNSSHV